MSKQEMEFWEFTKPAPWRWSAWTCLFILRGRALADDVERYSLRAFVASFIKMPSVPDEISTFILKKKLNPDK